MDIEVSRPSAVFNGKGSNESSGPMATVKRSAVHT